MNAIENKLDKYNMCLFFYFRCM